MLLQQRIDEVLDSVRLSDLLEDEGAVRHRVGLSPTVAAAVPLDEDPDPVAAAPRHATLPIFQG
jgi:hypothetical protein